MDKKITAGPVRRLKMLENLGYKLCVGLTEGKVRQTIVEEGGQRPRLYVKSDTVWKSATDIDTAYKTSQGYSSFQLKSII